MPKRKAETTEGTVHKTTIRLVDKIRPHLKELERSGELVDVLTTAWESEDWKGHIITKIDTKWSPLTNQDEMFNYDWKIDEDEYSDDEDEYDDEGIALNFASNNVRLDGREVDAKECSRGIYIIYGEGCQECSGDEVYSFEVQGKLDGSMRLTGEHYLECRCGGEEQECEETSFIAFPIKSKTSK